MKFIKGIKIFKSKIFSDKRGYFMEVYKKKNLHSKEFIFDCYSYSRKNVIRGLHIQAQKTQAKYLTVLKGAILDVVVDLRKNSKTFGKYFSIMLSTKNYCSIYIPEGFAHGFCTLKKENFIFYSCTNYQHKKSEQGILWNDKDLNINWPTKNPIVSDKDKNNLSFQEYCRKFSI